MSFKLQSNSHRIFLVKNMTNVFIKKFLHGSGMEKKIKLYKLKQRGNEIKEK